MHRNDARTPVSQCAGFKATEAHGSLPHKILCLEYWFNNEELPGSYTVDNVYWKVNSGDHKTIRGVAL